MKNAEIIAICAGLCMVTFLATWPVAYRLGRDAAPEMVAHREAVRARMEGAIPQGEALETCEAVLDDLRDTLGVGIQGAPGFGVVEDPFLR